MVVVDSGNELAIKSEPSSIAGFDFGLKTFLTCSDGSTIESPQFLKQSLKAILDLSVREWRCPSCQSVNGRDENAARNICAVGASTAKLGNVRRADACNCCSTLESPCL